VSIPNPFVLTLEREILNITRRISNVESKKTQEIVDNLSLNEIIFPGSTSGHASRLSYTPLDFINFEFCLLTLLETDGDSNEAQICCKLEHAYLDDPPQYHALSYCWGDPQMTVPIQVNGKPKQVTTNLEAAL
jgi:hypothetical protein